jgi:hypothetical protein
MVPFFSLTVTVWFMVLTTMLIHFCIRTLHIAKALNMKIAELMTLAKL